MPTYTFRNVDTGEETEKLLTLSERETFLEQNPNMKQCLSVVSFGDSVRLGITRTDNNFNDVLKNIKSHHRGSNIETR
jgi:hypothetical protein